MKLPYHRVVHSCLINLVVNQITICCPKVFLLVNTNRNSSNEGVIDEVWFDEIFHEMRVVDKNSSPQRGSDLLLRLPDLRRATNVVFSTNRGRVRIVRAAVESDVMAGFARRGGTINEIQGGEA